FIVLAPNPHEATCYPCVETPVTHVLTTQQRCADRRCAISNFQFAIPLDLSERLFSSLPQAILPFVMYRTFRLIHASVWLAVILGHGLLTPASSAGELLPPGFRPLPLGVHALVGGKLVLKPGDVLESGTIVIRDGKIQAVGKDLTPPPDARVWDMKGTVIDPVFIDPYLVLDSTNPPVSTVETEPASTHSFTAAGLNFFGAAGDAAESSRSGPGYEIARITPEHRAVREYVPREK